MLQGSAQQGIGSIVVPSLMVTCTLPATISQRACVFRCLMLNSGVCRMPQDGMHGKEATWCPVHSLECSGGTVHTTAGCSIMGKEDQSVPFGAELGAHGTQQAACEAAGLGVGVCTGVVLAEERNLDAV